MNIDAVVFDLYDTLVDTDSVTTECERVFAGEGATFSRTWRIKQLEYTWLLNSMGTYLDFHEVTLRAMIASCRSMRLDCDSETERSLLNAYLELRPFSDVEPALKEIGFCVDRLGVLSNGTPQMLDNVLQNSDLKNYFSGVFSVESVRVYKPNPKVYRLATERLDLPPRNIGFVSANSWDIAGAAAVGLTTIWGYRSNMGAEQVGGSATKEIVSLSDLSTVLSDLAN